MSAEILFVAVHESASGTFETCRPVVTKSAFKGSPEVADAGQTDANDPKRTSSQAATDADAARISRRLRLEPKHFPA